MSEETIFSKIIKKEIPARIIYEDEQCIAFHDVNPQAPVHVLIIPRMPIVNLNQASANDAPLLGHLLIISAKIAHDLKIDESGYRVVINNGYDSGQTVHHLHLHLLGGRLMKWPPG